MAFECFLGRDNYFGMIGQSEIIIRAEINDLLGFAAVLDGGARIGRSQKLRLVKFHRPCADVHPPGKTGRRLQRVAGFPSEKIAQAKFCGVLFVHSLWPVGRRGDRPYRGSHFSEDAARHKKFSQKPARFDQGCFICPKLLRLAAPTARNSWPHPE